MEYKNLFKKGKIGRLEIKNRAVMTPMGTNFADYNGMTTERLIKYYAERARGGIGLIINEFVGVDDVDSITMVQTLRASRHHQIASLERLTEAVHRYDCKIFAQLHHGGALSKPALTGKQPISSSNVPATPTSPVPLEMTKDDIKRVQQKFIDAAERCFKAGYDGVELHGAHSFLIAQFFSKYYNRRTDEYGGSLENRTRFISEIIDGIRERLGSAFPICVRISGDEMTENMMTLEDQLEIAKVLEKKGIDAINISNGSALNGNANCEPYSYKPGWKKHIAKAYKEALSIPVIATNTIKNPSYADSLLEEGVCDFVGLGRSQFADPEFMNKAKEGREEEIRQCIGCMHCRERLLAKDLPVECSVNPRLGREYLYPVPKKADICKRVVVVGGGPAGMEAAYVLAKRGFRVSLFEKGERLGGTLNVADKPKYKDCLDTFTKTMEALLKKECVQVLLNTTATIENVRELSPAGIFLAVGAENIIPPIKGVDSDNVYLPEDILLNRVSLKGDVAVIGSGMTGLETAETLAESGCRVKVVEMKPNIGPGLYAVVLNDILGRLNKYNTEFYASHRLLEITDGGFLAEDMMEGVKKEFKADHIVLSLGVSPRKGLVDEFKEAFNNVSVMGIGDASKGGRIVDATKDGFLKAYSFLD